MIQGKKASYSKAWFYTKDNVVYRYDNKAVDTLIGITNRDKAFDNRLKKLSQNTRAKTQTTQKELQ